MAARIQVCGRIVADMDGRRIEDALPGRQGRRLFAYLVLTRLSPATRDELVEALWPGERPAATEASLSALLSKLRRIVPLDGPKLALTEPVFVDLEAAEEAIHRAESGVRREAWAEAWGPARVALHTAKRGFLPGEDAPWIDQARRRLDDIRLRAHECVARSGLGLGGPELDSARRSANALIELSPFRESGYRHLMETLAAEGNEAEGLAVYERLRILLRNELGTAPSAATQQLHRRLLS